MHERQLRYQAAGVRVMWFVMTSKPFPQQTGKELPVFQVSEIEGVQVSTSQPRTTGPLSGASAMKACHYHSSLRRRLAVGCNGRPNCARGGRITPGSRCA